MAEKVIDILSRQPHMTGQVICLECKNEHTAVAPIGVCLLECDKCHLMKAVWKSAVIPETHWRCNCGCIHFTINKDGATCCYCGLSQVF